MASSDMSDIEDMDRAKVKQVPIEVRKDQFMRYLARKTYADAEAFNKAFTKANKLFRIGMGKNELYNRVTAAGIDAPSLKGFCVTQTSRSHSGVCVIATIMAPEFTFWETNPDGTTKKTRMKFTCKYDCSFCPNDPEQARSYPRAEPVPKRGQQNEFDVVRQAHCRMETLKNNHHTVDKLEWLILGGTWSSFPAAYRAEYHCSILFAANLWAEGINVCEIQGKLGATSNTRYIPDAKITPHTDLASDSELEESPVTTPPNTPTSMIGRMRAAVSALVYGDSDIPIVDIDDDDEKKAVTPEPDAWRAHVRPMLSIEEEMAINRKSTCRVIGITVETRPDEITLKELRFMRNLGVTRIQMGFQHTDNRVLQKNARGCSIERCIRGLRLAMENGFKVDGHWMPDLPGSNPELDHQMVTRAFTDPDLRCDQVKLYPCQVLDFTKIKEDYDSGKYKPYGEFEFEKLLDLIIYAKSIMPPWVRTNRVVRDFPQKIIKGGLQITHLNDLVLRELSSRRINCMCIRCREVKRRDVNHDEAKLHVREYEGCNGIEYFISMEVGTAPGILLGFCRLRINPLDMDLSNQFPELHGCALIRELHVYGNTTKSDTTADFTQHRGYGKMMLAEAERIAKINRYNKIAVISGVGVQDYYNRRGYSDGFYMIKEL